MAPLSLFSAKQTENMDIFAQQHPLSPSLLCTHRPPTANVLPRPLSNPSRSPFAHAHPAHHSLHRQRRITLFLHSSLSSASTQRLPTHLFASFRSRLHSTKHATCLFDVFFDKPQPSIVQTEFSRATRCALCLDRAWLTRLTFLHLRKAIGDS